MDIVEIPTSKIYSSINQNRQAFDDIEGLAADILANGLINPITVERDEGDRFALIAGERRYRAFVHANIETIPAVIRQGLTRVASMLITLGENDNRDETNDIEKGQGYQQALTMGATISQLQQAVNKRTDYIERRIALLRLRDDVQKLIADGQLSIQYGSAMVALDMDRQLIALTAYRDENRPSLTWFRSICNKLQEQQDQQAFDFGLFAPEGNMLQPADLAMAKPADPGDYCPSFDPYNLQSDIQSKINYWTRQGEQWIEIGNTGKGEQCATITETLTALLVALPVALYNSPADKIARLVEGSPSGMSTREIYQFANVNRSQWLPIKTDLLATGRIVETKSGRGFRYYSQ